MWEVTEGSLADAEHPRHLAEWLLRRSGPLTSIVSPKRSRSCAAPELPAADLQFHFAPAYFVDHGAGTFDGHALTLAPVLITPQAGVAAPAQADPRVKPQITTNTLSEPEDLAALVAGVKLAREIVGAEPLRSVRVRELFPGAGIQDDGELAADVRRRVELLYHPTGTCRMGTDDAAVVDPELRVRGVDGLRVVDASIMPLIPGGNERADGHDRRTGLGPDPGPGGAAPRRRRRGAASAASAAAS